MTIWILAVLLLASLAGLGYRQGAIRVAFSFIGILFSALLAVPLGHLLKPLLSLVGVKNPVLLWLIPPFVMFFVVLALFKVAGLAVHKKVEVHFKYKTGDLRLVLWERLNRRVGMCLGIVNGLAYLVLISFVIYAFSYWTVQTSASDSETWSVRLLNRLGTDLDSTGMTKVARAVDGMPKSYYDAADTVGLVYHTPQLEVRLARYPAFFNLSERPEFQDIGSDAQFKELRQKQPPLKELLNHSRAQAILKNPDLLNAIWAAAAPNLEDLNMFLTNGVSPKFDPEKLLGRWDFDVNGALALMRRTKANLTPLDLTKWKNWMAVSFRTTQFIATPEQQVFLKNAPSLKGAGAAAAAGQATLQGHWKNSDGKYELTLEGRSDPLSAEIQGERLVITGDAIGMVFVRQD